jgi:hypothetical protein
MTTKAILNLMKGSLEDWARENSAHVSVAGDEAQALSLLMLKPGAPHVAITFNGASRHGRHDEFRRLTRSFIVYVSLGKPRFVPGADTSEAGPAGARPLIEIVDEVLSLIWTTPVPVSESEEGFNFISATRPRTDLDLDYFELRFDLSTPAA